MLKALTAIFIFLSTLISHAQNIADLESFEKVIKPGTQLTYNVSSKAGQYDLVITLKKTEGEIAFDWQANDSQSRKGSITLTPACLAQATALNSNFTPGAIKLQDESIVWISKKIFNDAATISQAGIKLNGSADTVTMMSNTISEFNFTLDGNLMDVPGWNLQGGPDNKYTVDVLESVKFPIIFKLDIGFSMTLTEIKSK